MPYTLTYEGDDTHHLAAALGQMVDLVARFQVYEGGGDEGTSGDFVIKRATKAHVWLQPWSDKLGDEDPDAPEHVVYIDNITDVFVY